MTICKGDYCNDCKMLDKCGGCEKCKGHPFGGDCIAATIICEKGYDEYLKFKEQLVNEVNKLKIEDLHIDDLNLLIGSFVNLEYTMPNGEKIKLLKDNNIYLANQVERANSDRCYGVVCSDSHILVSEYGCYGSDPQIVLLKTRDEY